MATPNTMNYNDAVLNLFKKHSKSKPMTNKQILKTMPKGWMLLCKDGNMYDNRTDEELAEDEWNNDVYRKYELYKTHVQHFLTNITIDMLKENCNVDEINGYIETLFYNDDEEDEEHDEESYDEMDDYESDVSM